MGGLSFCFIVCVSLSLYFIIYFHFLLHSSTWLKKRYKFDPTAGGGDRKGRSRQFCFIYRFVFFLWTEMASLCFLSNLLMRLHNVFRNVTLIVIDIFIFFSHCFQLEIARSVWRAKSQVVNIPDLTPDSGQSISPNPGMWRSQEAIFFCQILIGLFTNLRRETEGERPWGILSVYWNYKSHPGAVILIGMIMLILIWVSEPDRNTGYWVAEIYLLFEHFCLMP